ncbi:MAG: 4-hydroxythreonine-4-phosphate dehydrogenase PdxA [Hyphomicrobiales bacterium]|nr:4-hydroxythreonine-4-phosphate dehydrogenase PdxA [Hyphomicrobiales bacterium]
MTAAPPLLAMTQGDPAGIGPELALAAWEAARADPALPRFALLADPDLMRRRERLSGKTIPVVECAAHEAASLFADALPVIPLSARAIGTPGAPDVGDAPSTIEAIERAVDLVMSGSVAGVVTNPIAKDVLYRAGFAHPGHTEFLGELAAQRSHETVHPVMMLWSDELAVVPVTIHVALKDVPRLLTRELIVSTGKIVAADLRARFGVARPRLVVSGLNPHAGENGSLGREEIETIAPAVAALVAAGIDARGPLSADTMFHGAARAQYDAALCMTHDQALIPIKTLAFDTGVNVTLGLPFVRTSPDHGTAFDIAGKGLANPSSLIAALRLAGRLAARAAA